MPCYAMLSTLTDEGRKTLKNNPGRILEVNREVEEMGAKVIRQYAALGSCDFITIGIRPAAAPGAGPTSVPQPPEAQYDEIRIP